MTKGTITVDAAITADRLVTALQETGATVVWTGPKAAKDTSITLEVEVDEQDAFEALPGDWFMGDDEPSAADPSPADISDFIDACRRADRGVALALLPRIVLSEACLLAGEQLLLGGRA